MFAASFALTVTTFLAVIVGSEMDRFIPAKTIKIAAGIGFIGIGVYTLWTVR